MPHEWDTYELTRTFKLHFNQPSSSMIAGDLMTTDVATVTPETLVTDIADLMLARHISAVPVVDTSGRLVGMVSEGDLIQRAELGVKTRRSWWLRFLGGSDAFDSRYVSTHGVRAADVMSRKVISVREDAPIAEIALLLEAHRIKRVPVMREGRVVGIVSRADLLRGLVSCRRRIEQGGSHDDESIRAQLIAVLQDELGINFVNPTVVDGVVHLWGFAASGRVRQALRVAAEGIPGVRAVEDHLCDMPVDR